MLSIWITIAVVVVLSLLILAIWDIKRRNKVETQNFTGHTIYLQEGDGPDLTRQGDNLASKRLEFSKSGNKIELEKLDVYVADEEPQPEKLDVFVLSADESKIDKFGEETTEDNIVI